MGCRNRDNEMVPLTAARAPARCESMSIAITLPTVLTCPVCGRSDESRPVFQVWDEGRGFVTKRDDTREWTEEVLSPLALRIAPPAPPTRRWLLAAAGLSLLLAVVALFFLLQAPNYTIGNLSKPGPGLFPVMVAVTLLVISVAIVVRSYLIEALPFEHPKLSATAIIQGGDFAERLDKAIARSAAVRLIEHEPVRENA